MQRTKRRDTPAELALRKRLHARGYRYRTEYRLPGLRRTADFAFPRERLAVFVDGCFWHACPDHATWPKQNGDWWREKILRNVARDRETDQLLADAGWKVVRVWEHEEAGAAADRVEAELARRRSV